jgi:secondary thiamine-phosphate synthase enzyme
MAFDLRLGDVGTARFRVFHDRADLRTTERLEFVDLTTLVIEAVRRSGITHGTVNVQTRHTTTAVIVNENEPLLLDDLKRLLERLVPGGGRYRHDDLAARAGPLRVAERLNGAAHARAVLLGCSETLDILDGRVQLGRWQSVFLVELDGGQARCVSITVMGLDGDDRPPALSEPRERVRAGKAS